jgi:hypothetical protein
MTAARDEREAWQRLAAELDRWGPGEATLWWRDDDAALPTPALDRLLALGPQPLALAVIPGQASALLPERLAGRPVDVLQHGFAHVNHEPAGEKKAELGSARPAATVLGELARGRQRLERLFGRRALPVLVPPWNRIAEALVDRLPGLGYAGLSTYGPRPAAPGLHRVNTHVDIIDWRGGRAFIGAAAALDLTLAHLSARRTGRADRREPTGILTHHLVMAEAGFAFLGELLAASARHPAVQWLGARDIFPAGKGIRVE